MKNCLLVLLLFVLGMISYAEAGSEELQPRTKGFEYAGAIKAKSQADGMITMESQGGPIDFYWRDDGKRDCSSWQDLSVGDKVVVSYTEKKSPLEVTCVRKIVPPDSSSSISIGGSVTIGGGVSVK
jgi:hypothetical protein